MTKTLDYKMLTAKDSSTWRNWLDKNHKTVDGIWLRIYKKNSKKETVTYAEALDEALCYGWIDGQKKSLDEESYLQKFTPRRKRSMWSKINVKHIARLTKAGLMEEAGFAEVERAKSDGRWQAAYESAKHMKVPTEFVNEVKKNRKAYEFYKILNKTNLYHIGLQLQTAKKPETKARRTEKIIKLLEEHQKPN